MIHWVVGDLEHLTIETRLIGESFECVMGECVSWEENFEFIIRGKVRAKENTYKWVSV